MAAALVAQSGRTPPAAASNPANDWPTYRHDQAGTGYSPLSQIDARNVATLAEAWTYSLQAASPQTTGRGGAPAVNSQATPIVVNGVMYVPAADRVVALEPETGKVVWEHTIAGGALSRRGVAYWTGEGSVPPRIIFTAGRRLIAVNAKTGERDFGFGTDGAVDMGVPYNSVPLVYKNVVVVGANTPPGAIGGVGNPRAFDARNGAKLWEFNSVAQPGDVGHDTWEGDSWKGRLGANAWPFYFTLDEQRGLLYLPLASPIVGAYGGDRKGANLFGNSVVAVDVLTGMYKWHFQTIHHDLWDHDPPAPPGLFEITRNGRTVPALGVTTKSGYLYILNRETGQPIFGVEERAVVKSDVPGEMASPTQPIPVKPPPLGRVAFAPQDLVTAADTTPEHAKACADLVAANGGLYNAGPFTPWAYRAEGAPPKVTVNFPGGLGGANWGGIAFDRRSGFILVVSQDVGALGWIEKAKEGSPVPYDKATPERPGPGRGVFDVRIGDSSWPCQKPPWGRLTAINASTGDVAWQVPLGITEQLPAGKQNTGRPVLAGPIVTASGLIFVASTDDNRFRALDARSGKELWVTRLARRGNADPITYRGKNGKQYVAIAATDTLVVFALP
jgi:glucose dehydrogenase